jgi:type IV pilus assembly protein PilA
MRNYLHKGFTLLDLMVTIAIIGVLAAVAWPAYQNFVAKAYTAAAYAEIAPVMTGVDLALARGELSGIVRAYDSRDLIEYGIGYDETNATLFMTLVGYMTDRGFFMVQSTLKGPDSVRCKVIQLKRQLDNFNATGAWTCKTNVDAKFAPASCIADPNLSLLNGTNGC